jgi:hypothetical protein
VEEGTVTLPLAVVVDLEAVGQDKVVQTLQRFLVRQGVQILEVAVEEFSLEVSAKQVVALE